MSLIENITLSYFIDLYLADNPVLKYFYNQLYTDFNPDVTGYTLVFMIPPDLSGFNESERIKDVSTWWNSITKMLTLTSAAPKTFKEYSKMIPFLANDFTPPETQVQAAQVQTRSGASTYATDIITTENITISYLESNPINTYKFHLMWIEYIKEILKGTIKPKSEYLTPDDSSTTKYGAIDYLASVYIVKYMQDMKTITYISKCTGIYPTRLPSKELLGTRNTNEITMLNFEYACTMFHEYVHGLACNEWIYKELNTLISGMYSSLII